MSKPSDRHPAIEQMMEIEKIPVEMLPRHTGQSHLSLGRFIVYPLSIPGELGHPESHAIQISHSAAPVGGG